MERNFVKALAERTVLTELVRNIRSVRHQMLSAKGFDETLFAKINGDDAALESLVGRNVFFTALSDSERLTLHREIMDKLAMQEIRAFDKLRSTLASYLSDLDKSLESYKAEEHHFDKLAIKPEVAALLAKGSTDLGLYTKKDVDAALVAFEKVTSFIKAVTPVMARVKANEDDAEEPAGGEEVLPDNGGSTAAEPEKIEPNSDPMPMEHSVVVTPVEETDQAAMTEILAAAQSNRSMAMSRDAFKATGSNMGEAGYCTVEDLTSTITAIEKTMSEYVEVVKNFRALLPIDTCTSDELAHGSAKFYATFDGLMDLIGTSEDVRKNLDQTKLTLVETLEALERGI